MIDLPPAFYIHVWPEAPYFITVSAFSPLNLFVTFGVPLLSPNLSFIDRRPRFMPYIGGPHYHQMEDRRRAAKLQIELHRIF